MKNSGTSCRIYWNLQHLSSTTLQPIFFQELLQNADDNHYADSCTPTLTFTYMPGSLRVDCNEVGFEAAHVKAISSVRRSTKSLANHSKGYTGEKGIGFKSVFRIADVIWLSSRQYQFKFDKRDRLGMMAPRWAEFPQPTLPGETSFFLQLSDACNESDLVQQLRDFDPILLIFMRRVERVNLRAYRNNEDWERIIQRQVLQSNYGQITVLSTDDQKSSYFTVKYPVENLPQEARRPKVVCSDLDLAFPVMDMSTRPSDRRHDAFLHAIDSFNKTSLKYFWPYFVPTAEVSYFFQPARNIILKMVSRNKVLESSSGKMFRPSNLVYVDPTKYADEGGTPFTLGHKTEDLYLSSCYPDWLVDEMLDLGVRKLDDEIFLGDLLEMISSDASDFYSRSPQWHSSLAKSLLPLIDTPILKKHLMELPLVPLLGGGWTSAKEQPGFLDQDLDPSQFPYSAGILIVDPCIATNENQHSLFERLGIKDYDRQRMCEWIVDIHRSSDFDPTRMTRQQLISHADFLFKSSWRPRIPCEVDLWFATSQDERCKGSQLYIPRQFLPDSSTARACKKLRQSFPTAHILYFKPNSLRPRDHLEEIMQKGMDIVNSTTNNLGKSNQNQPSSQQQQSDVSQLWIQHQRKHQEPTKPSPNSSKWPIDLHPDYTNLDAAPKEQQWPDFLIGTLHLSEIPRLISWPNGDLDKYCLSEEFKFLIRECPVSDVLNLLNDNWREYSVWIEKYDHPEAAEKRRSRKNLVKDVGASLVSTRSGCLPLCETALPGLDLRIDELEIPAPILDMDMVQSQDRDLRRRMSYFGIKVENDLHYYIMCLSTMQRCYTFPDKNAVSYLYKHIYWRYDENYTEIQSVFQDHPYIYVGNGFSKPGEVKTWYKVRECKRKKIDPSHLYPECGELFSSMIHNPDQATTALVTKVATINRSWTLGGVCQLLIELGAMLRDEYPLKAKELVECLRAKAFFPIRHRNCQSISEIANDLRNSYDTTWFVPDRPQLVQSFTGKVPLLAMSPKEVTDISALLTALNLDSRRLSRVTHKREIPSGSLKVCTHDTRFFQARHQFIEALIHQETAERDIICRQVRNAKIITAAEIYEEYILEYKDIVKCHGSRIRAEVALPSRPGQDWLHIFTTQDVAISEQPSFTLMSMVAAHCDITGPDQVRLLYMALADTSLTAIQRNFEARGYHIEREDGDSRPVSETLRSGGTFTIPSPFQSGNRPNFLLSTSDESRTVSMRYSLRSGGEFVYDWRYDIGSASRRIPIMFEDVCDSFSTELDEDRLREYIGQYYISTVLKQYLMDHYDPIRNWTSNLRVRAGLIPFENEGDKSSFTFDESTPATAMNLFIRALGHPGLKQDLTRTSIYHIDVAVCTGNDSSNFVWSTSHLNRLHHHHQRLSENEQNFNILVLVKDIFGEPKFTVHIDPWSLLVLESLLLERGIRFLASVDINHETTIHQSLSSKAAGPTNSDRLIASGEEMSPLLTRAAMGFVQYSYSNLDRDQIRLFLLFPGSGGDLVKGKMITVHSSAPEHRMPYQTLSYVWGSDHGMASLISVDDSFLNITDSLHSALVHLRQDTQPIMLWIDAICINQQDNIEKSQQIRLLAKIFQQAKRTLAFLGADHESDTAMEILLQIRAKDLGETSGTGWPSWLPPVPEEWAGLSTPRPENPIWLEIKKLFSRPWFRRVWIIQEAVVPPEVRILCGKYEVDWADVYGALDIVSKRSFVPIDISISWQPFIQLSYLREHEIRKVRFNLLTLLETFRHVGSKLKRDRFFALLGLACDGDDRNFDPDYNEDTTFEDIACRFGCAFVNQKWGMSLLYRAGLDPNNNRFPSWLPDLTVSNVSLLDDLRSRGTEYNASRGLQERIECKPGNVLSVTGCLIDEIEQVSKHSNEQLTRKRLQYFNEIDSMVEALRDEDGGKDKELERMKWKVPVAGASHPRVVHSGYIDLEDSYIAFRRCLKKDGMRRKKVRKELLDDEMTDSEHVKAFSGRHMTWREKSRSFESLLNDILLGWRFVTTKRGFCGLVPGTALVGDIVGILGGGDVPFLLRKATTGEKNQGRCYRLVGTCYMYGMMDGEALELDDVHEKQLRII
ncbi:hypothetical protein DL98DRAFT_626637 [Cadophora sp. DSE1049]|nr:hypothetical protein DL98DRAFT_626637 [Cadophora sp. DSE1049]